MDIEELKEKHEHLVNVILTEEEELLSTHRLHIDENVELVKRQMNILNEVDKPGSDVEEYINNLDHILTQHLEMIKNLKNKVTTFRGHLNTEAVLSK